MKNEMNKHAFCLIAHKDLTTLNQLISRLDDERNDLFLFIDSKSTLNLDDIYKPQYSKIKFAERHSVYWGHVSQIEAEMKLFKLAQQEGEYAYFHLISGQDLPLMSPDKMHKMFDTIPPGTNFIGYGQGEAYDRETFDRVRYIVPYTKYLGHPNKIVKYLFGVVRVSFVMLQKVVKFKRNLAKGVFFKRGCNWASMSNDFINYLISQEAQILKFYRWTPCCDEVYKQTLAWNSDFKKTLYNPLDEFEGCMREIDWERGGPWIWRKTDIDRLCHSNRFFARKFDSTIDESIINEIINKLAET